MKIQPASERKIKWAIGAGGALLVIHLCMVALGMAQFRTGALFAATVLVFGGAIALMISRRARPN